MRVDLYTKAVLTVIAACLFWLCMTGKPGTLVVHAQADTAQLVRLVGWVDAGGRVHSFPASRQTDMAFPVVTR